MKTIQIEFDVYVNRNLSTQVFFRMAKNFRAETQKEHHVKSMYLVTAFVSNSTIF